MLLPGWSRYIPHQPYAKQLAFCMLPHREALYGGAAGGGKSDALLMAALQFIEVPYYTAIIFRRTLTDLMQPEGLLARALEWLSPHPEFRYIASQHEFVTPWRSKLVFGYIGNMLAWEHKQGSAIQFCAFDELTQHAESDYREMFSRLRRVWCETHKKNPVPDCDDCQLYGQLAKVPLRMRATANPGGRGHTWVRKRFKIHRDKESDLWVGGDRLRPFISAVYTDNLALDQVDYGKSLDELDEARRAQLKEGDWDKLACGLYKEEWFRKFAYHGGYYNLINPDNGRHDGSFHENALRIFQVVDVAMSVRTGVKEHVFYRHRDPSWTVILTCGITSSNKLLLLDLVRIQEESPEVFTAMRTAVRRWRPMYVGVDATGPGKALAQLASQEGIPVKELRVWYDKIANSAEAQNIAKSGRIYFPEDAPWLDDFLGEILIWTGHPHETDDQIDVLSNAGHELTSLCGNLSRDFTLGAHVSEMPITTPMHTAPQMW
jgi:predicted phage terminase large subunit-like protein